MIKLIATITLILTATALFSQEPRASESVSINGKHIYYEVYGDGPPLLLLHGFTLSSKHWKPYVTDYTADYSVYLVDLTGHGRSDPFNEELSIRSVAKDLDSLITYLKLEKIKAIGFSFGGDVLYQLALIHPDLIEKMITIGAVGTWTIEDFPDYLEVFTFENRADFPWLAESHEGDAQIKSIMEQFKNYIVEVSDQELQSISTEVLIMVGDDDDGMDLREIARVRDHLPNSDLWILPGVSHGAHEGETKEEFLKKSKIFLAKD